jgi:hypothetical protein
MTIMMTIIRIMVVVVRQDESFLMLASETGRDEYPHHSLSWLLHAKRSYRTFRIRQKSNHWGSKQLFLQVSHTTRSYHDLAAIGLC